MNPGLFSHLSADHEVCGGGSISLGRGVIIGARCARLRVLCDAGGSVREEDMEISRCNVCLLGVSPAGLLPN